MRHRRPAFFSLPALLLMGVMIALVLYLLFPRQAIFEDLRYLDSPDAISLAYLETLLRSDPDNVPLRVNLGRMQRQAGHLSQARQTLEPLLQQEAVPSHGMEGYLGVLISQIHTAPEGERKAYLKQDLEQALRRLQAQNYSLDRKLDLAQPALPLLDPQQQLAIREALFAEAEGLNRLNLARQLSIQYQALEQPALAVDILGSVLGEVPSDQRTAFVRELIRLNLAAERPGRALALFRTEIGPDLRSPGQLREGLELAGLAGAEDIRREWLGALARVEPGDLEVQRQWLLAQLGEGDTGGALVTLRRMQAHGSRLSVQDQIFAAQILEWNGEPAEALEYWQRVYRATGSAQAFEQSTRLAAELFQWDDLVSLLERARTRDALSADGYQQLADSLIRLGRLDIAETRLREGLARYEASRPIRERLITHLFNLRRFPAAIELLESDPALSDAGRLQLANLYWRVRDPGSALEVLMIDVEDPELAVEAAIMRLELAKMLGRTGYLQSEYERLSDMPLDSLSQGMQEQLLSLAVMLNDTPGALRLARQRFADTGSPRYLNAMAEYQLELDDWRGLAETLGRWQQVQAATGNPRFWTLTALLAQHREQTVAANEAYRRAAELAPNDTGVLVSWSWFLLANPEQSPGRLPQLLSRLAANPSPQSYGILAWGYQVMGDRRRALAWLGRGRALNEAEGEWLMSMALLAEQNGAVAEGQALRRQAVALGEAPAEQSKLATLYPAPRNTGEVTGPLYRFDNRALQTGVSIQDLGGFPVHRQYVRGQFSHDRFRWLFSAEQLDARERGLLREIPETGADYRLQWQNNVSNTLLTLNLGLLSRYGGPGATFGVEVTGQPGDRFTLTSGLAINDRAQDSAEAWWLAERDSVYTRLEYQPFTRLRLSGQVEYLSYDSTTGSRLGEGFGFDATGTYTLFRQDPAWQASIGYRHQVLGLANTLDSETSSRFEVPASPQTLLTDEYQRVGINTRWYHGEPQALYRTTPEPRFFVGLGTGYVLSTSRPDFRADLGFGWRVVGDDDLAFSVGYSSEGLDGSSRTNLNLTYTLYFGR